MNTNILQTIFADCPMGIAHLEIIEDEQNKSADYRFLEVNKVFLNICGLNPANISGKTVSQLFSKTETTFSDWHNLFDQIGKSDKTAEFEFYFEDKNQWFSVNTWQTVDKLLVISLTNINYIKRNLIELQEQIENHTNVINKITDVLWEYEVNSTGTFIRSYISPVVNKLLEIPQGTIDQSFEDFFRFIHPDDIISVQNKLSTSIFSDEQKIHQIEYRVYTPEGQTKYLRSSGTVHIKTNGNRVAIGTTTDISALKLKEEELIKTKELTEEINANVTAILEGTSDNIWAFDSNYNILYINNVFQKEFKASFGVWLEKGSNLLNALPDELKTLWKPRYDRTLSKEQFTIIDELETAVGKLFIQVTFNPIINNGKVIGGSCFGCNITERKRVENELQLQALVLDQIMDHVTITDLNGKITYVNKAVAETMKLAKHEIIGNSTIIYGEDAKRGASQQEIFINTLKSGNWWGEVVNYDNNGTEHIMDCRTQVVYNKNKIPVALCGIATEITERKQVEESLQKIQNRNHALLEAIPDLIFVFNQEYTFIDYHANNKDTMLVAPEVFIGKKISDTLPEPLANKTIDILKKVFSTKQMQEYEYELEVNGKQQFFEARAVYSTHEQALIIVRDVSQRKYSELSLKQAQKYLAEKEAQYRLIAENSTDLIYVYQLVPEPHYEYISPSCFQITGYKPEEGYADPFVYHKFINTPKGVDRFTQFLLNPDQPTTIEEEWRKKDDTYIWVEQVISRKFDESGNLVSFQSTVRDITDRKNAEKILYTERMRLEGIIKGTKTGTWEWNIQSGNVIYNERWAEIIGYTLEEISPSIETWMKFVHPEDLKISNEILNKHFKGELDYYETEIRMQHKDGHWVWIIDRGKLVSRTDDGKPLMMLGTHQDITERKLAEVKLLSSEKKFRELSTLMRLMTDNMPDMLWAKNLNKEFIFTNKAICNILLNAVNTEEPLGKTDLFFATRERNSQPDNILWHTFGEICRDSDSITLAEMKPMQFDEFGNVKGKFLFLDVYKAPLYDDQGLLIGLVGSARDITERKLAEEALKESESRLEFVIEGSYLGYWDWNIINGKVYRNKIWAEMLGFTIEEIELNVKQWSDLQHPDDREAAWEAISKHLNDETVQYRMEYRMRTKDGNYKWILDQAKIVERDAKGKPVRMCGTHTDISERKRAEEALKESEKMLREINAQKDKFFSIIAHDLKSPFNSILGFSQLLVEQIQSKDYDGIEEYAKIMLHSSEHAFSLLSNLLEWSQAQSGKIEFNPEFFELIEFIDNIIPIFDGVAKQKSINIIRMLPHNTPIYADKHMISTVLRNLINNAIKFTKQGGEIKVAVKNVMNDVVISVKDNGIGIAKNRIEKLFRIDESESTPGTANEKGTGLGLILCKEFIEKHNGKIWVESDVGIGSAFSISIPAYKRL